ncbi:PTS lactose/cellobiose transporter subunit IIA [Neobacillus niacini]|uniref:PTS lactose/cellobiose transporter subunit IIA n=1 Tax=Neobacillus niacini TaxID=86668 RepID=UPI00300304B7
MDNLEVAMGLIAGAGDSRSYCMEAIGFARDGQFEDAREAVEKAVTAMVETHEIQTQLIRDEIEGKGEAVSLIMVHAQDHLNLALVMRDVAEEFISLYERIKHLEGR